jgi:hypothetical protein
LAKDIRKFETDLKKTADSELERLKADLKAQGDISIEQLRSHLQQAVLEHQVRFSKLHEKRGEVIEQVYQQLVEAEKGYGRFVLVDGYERDMEKQTEARLKTETAMYDVSLFIEKHRIYLPITICDSLKAFLDIMWNNVINVGVYAAIKHPTPHSAYERNAAFTKAYQALTKEIPSAREALGNEFRNLLGVDGASSLAKAR